MTLRKIFSGLGLCAAFALAFQAADVHAARPGTTQGTATVTSLKGSPSYTTEASGVALPLKQGMKLSAGTTIATSAGDEVVLDLKENGGAVHVRPNTEISIDTLLVTKTGADAVVETGLSVKKGSILGNVKKLSANSKYNVTTAKGTAGIRGTVFEVLATGVFKCHDGRMFVVVVIGATPAPPTNLGKGQQVDASQATTQAQIQVLLIPVGEGRDAMRTARRIAREVSDISGSSIPDVANQIDKAAKDAQDALVTGSEQFNDTTGTEMEQNGSGGSTGTGTIIGSP